MTTLRLGKPFCLLLYALSLVLRPQISVAQQSNTMERRFNIPAGSKSFDIRGRAVAIGWDRSTLLATSAPNEPIDLSTSVDLDLSGLQAAVVYELNAYRRENECGDNYAGQDFSFNEISDGAAQLRGSIQFKQYVCLDGKLRSLLGSQPIQVLKDNISVSAVVVPRINDSALSLDVELTSIEPRNDLVRGIVEAFNLRAVILQLVQNQLDNLIEREPLTIDLNGGSLNLRPVISRARFVRRSNDQLGGQISGVVEVDADTFFEILSSGLFSERR
ncbi:hypothetical protein [Jiella pelagia]|uniref:Uncharacterized protein n=1 Tax=Jiella pelagia TaxID=2986949 RepID=A0ABY7C4A3_9HYPH|nr:hypothetical protein [Jiella pelagia]WAP70906.1 hypothetical protein OH818_13555 [Jiella pelagia]